MTIVRDAPALRLAMAVVALALTAVALACGPSAPSEQSEDPTPTPEPTATATAESTATAEPTAPSESKLEGVDPLLQAWYRQDEHKWAVAAAAGASAPSPATVRVLIGVVNAEALPDLEAFLTDRGATEVASGEGDGLGVIKATVPLDLIPELAAQPGLYPGDQSIATKHYPYEKLDSGLNIDALEYETGLLPTKEKAAIGVLVIPEEGGTFAETRASFLKVRQLIKDNGGFFEKAWEDVDYYMDNNYLAATSYTVALPIEVLPVLGNHLESGPETPDWYE